MNSLVKYFINRPIVVNALMFTLLLSSVFVWQKIGKEEMPDFAMNWLRISIKYPGASAADVESFITKPVEEKLKSVSSLDTVTSTSSFSSSSFRVGFEANVYELNEKIKEAKEIKKINSYSKKYTHIVMGSGSNDPEKYSPEASRETLDQPAMSIFTVDLEDGCWHH